MKSNAIVLTSLATLAAAAGSTASKADIRVDTNRDGIVDVDGTSDQAGKDTWTAGAGAIFLPNIGDTGGRCKELHKDIEIPYNLKEFYEKQEKCHDADDDTQRAPQYLAPMRTVPITGLSESATGTISVADEKSRALVRVFRKVGEGKWEIVNNDTVLKAQDLQQGLTLGVDARSTRRPEWDGRVKIDFAVRDGETETKDSVMLRVAPVLVHHHLQPIDQVLAAGFPGIKGTMKTYLDSLLDSIQTSVKAAGISKPLYRIPTSNPWAQDFFEPTYASMPGPDGNPVSIRVLLEAFHETGTYSGATMYSDLRREGVGAVAPKRPDNLFKTEPVYNAGGNIEALPPYERDGKKFPAGRIIVGGGPGHQPSSLDFFAAQEMQDPLTLDSSWLKVKHVDEIVQAVPAKTERGWAILVIDPAMGLQMLRDAAAAGHGKERVINRAAPARAGSNIEDFLKRPVNAAATEIAAKAMEANIEILKRETGITDAEIHRVPALISTYKMAQNYQDWTEGRSRRRGLAVRNEADEIALDKDFAENFPSHVYDDDDDETAADEADKAAAEQRRQLGPRADTPAAEHNSVLPSLVNGVPLSGSHYMAPKPHGPVIEGKDIFEEAAAAAYKKAGFTTVDFVEEWRIHNKAGDLHCMSNTYRSTSDKWW